MLELFILANLMLGSCHGYEIKKVLSGVKVNNNTIYPLLKKMQDNGYVTMDILVQDGKPSRKVYHITDVGRKHFVQLMTDFDQDKAVVSDEFYIRVAFFQFIDKDDIKNILDSRDQALDNYAHSQRIMNFLKPFSDDNSDIAELHSFADCQASAEKHFVQSLREKYNL